MKDKEVMRPITALGVVGAGALLGVAVLGVHDPVRADASTTHEGASAPDEAPGERARGGMIPREALVDMARAQSGIICSSEIFLGCMGFDGTTCLTLSESAIDQCLLTLPAEICPDVLDNATLEACPTAIYAKAGHDESKAQACLEKALDEY